MARPNRLHSRPLVGQHSTQLEQLVVKHVRDPQTHGQSVSLAAQHHPTARARQCTRQGLQSYSTSRHYTF